MAINQYKNDITEVTRNLAITVLLVEYDSRNNCSLTTTAYSRWAKLNGANAVSFVVAKHVSENSDNFWHIKSQFICALCAA